MARSGGGESSARLRCGTTGCRRRVQWVDGERLANDPLRYLCGAHWMAMKTIRLPDAERYKPVHGQASGTDETRESEEGGRK
jgi:hypothetical protein